MSSKAKIIVETSGPGKYTYKWEVNNWNRNYDTYGPGQYIVSPKFEILDSTWYLHLYPNGKNENSRGYISINFYRMHSDKKPIDVRYAFTFINSADHIIGIHDTMKKERFRAESSLEFKEVNTSIHRSTIQKCAYPYVAETVIIIGKMITQEGGIQETLLTSDAKLHLKALQGFINNQRFSDVKLKVDGKEFFAHKMMLSAHSPVFAAMFEHQMLENTENYVIINDISCKAFCELLRYIYLGEVRFEKCTVTDLLKAADKYQLLTLKNLCEKELCKDFSVDNMFAHLNLADYTHNAVDLKEAAVDFIVNNINFIIHKPELETLQNLDTSLFKMILQRIITKKNVDNVKA